MACMHYRLIRISEKAVILMITWNALFSISVLLASYIGIFNTTREIVMAMSVASLYPIVGWLADSWFGRFKVLKASVYLFLFATICNAIYVFVFHSSVVHVLSILGWSLSFVCWISTIMQFTFDQCIGASAEQLSFTIYWLVWGFALADVLCNIIPLCLHFTPYFSYDELKLSIFVLSAACVVGVVIIMENCSHLLTTKTALSNPIKLIYQVLNYARQHRYPERRSAFTYWDADYPSRIDLGKDKYGGPFTVEQIEDVKTTLRLIPMTFCTAAFAIGMWRNEFQWLSDVHSFCHHSLRDPHQVSNIMRIKLDSLLFKNTLFFPCLLLFFGIPMYHFVIYPVLYNFIPSILKRIGTGIFLMALSYAIDAFIQMIGQGLNNDQVSYNNSESCVLDNDQAIPSINCFWTLIPRAILAFAIAVVAIFLMEFIVAQSPQQVKGFLLTVMSMMFGALSLVGFALDKLLISFPIHVFPGCTFYNSLLYTLAMFAVFTLFVVVSNWYKLRKREDVVPYHLFAEDNFESNLEEERRHLINLGYDLENER